MAKAPVYGKDDQKGSIKPDLGKEEKILLDPIGDRKKASKSADSNGEEIEKNSLANLDSVGDEIPDEESTSETSLARGTASGGKSFYKSHKGVKNSGFGGRLSGSRNFKKYLIVGGFTAAILAAVIALFSFLNVFKLDGLMSSIEQRAFLRTNATLDTRSSKLISAYVEARMLDMGDNPNFDNPDFKKNDNLLFRSNRVDTNNPFFDWYKTMRASKFEQEVFEKDGIKFTSMVTADGKFRTGVISLNGNKKIPFNVHDISAADFQRLSQGDIATINKFGDIVDSKAFSGNKEARNEIKRIVNKNTYAFQVYKRRALRKSIQNMTGVKDWRFFETSRDKLAQKRIDIRNKILNRMVPDTNLLGKVTRCLFGVDKCSANRDTAAETNHADVSDSIGDPDPNAPDNTKKVDPTLDQSWDPGQISDFLKKILAQANLLTKISNLPSTLDMLSNVDGNIKTLVKFVVIARGAQAAGLFQVFETSRDQIKTGQVTSDEVNQFMHVVDTAGSSDGQNKIIEGHGDPGTAYNQGACSEKNQALYDKNPAEYKRQFGDYAYLCSNQRIGSAANAQEVQDAYNGSIGLLIHPIAVAWSGANSTPILGTFISVIRWVGNQISSIQDAIVNEVLSVLGLKDDVNGLITYVFSKVSNFLGVAILNGNESPGTFFNWLVQGGSYSAESAARQNGAALTTPDSKAAVQNAISLYQDSQKSAPLFDRVASLSNPDSLAFRGAMTLESVKSNPSGMMASGIGSMFNSLGRNFAMVFGRSSFAAAPNGYAASSFADIETYDYAPKCYGINPITTTPINGTNALQVFQASNIHPSQAHLDELNSWDTEKDRDKFFSTIYSIIKDDGGIKDNADDIAVKIYNCNLLDATVRDDLGYTHGYSAGPGYDVVSTAPSATQPSGSNSSTATPAGATIDMVHLFDDSTSIGCAAGTNDVGIHDGYTAGNLVKIRLCTIPGFSSSSEDSTAGSQYYIAGANGNVLVNSRVSGAVLAMFSAAKKDGLTLTAISSFRSMAHQQSLCPCDGVHIARPGYSNHQMGLAIDFGGGLPSTPGPIPGNAFWNWLSQKASLYGYKNYPVEAWHWSPTGN